MKNEFEVQKLENSRKNVFETPQLEVIYFESEDIITQSGQTDNWKEEPAYPSWLQ